VLVLAGGWKRIALFGPHIPHTVAMLAGVPMFTVAVLSRLTIRISETLASVSSASSVPVPLVPLISCDVATMFAPFMVRCCERVPEAIFMPSFAPLNPTMTVISFAKALPYGSDSSKALSALIKSLATDISFNITSKGKAFLTDDIGETSSKKAEVSSLEKIGLILGGEGTMDYNRDTAHNTRAIMQYQKAGLEVSKQVLSVIPNNATPGKFIVE